MLDVFFVWKIQKRFREVHPYCSTLLLEHLLRSGRPLHALTQAIHDETPQGKDGFQI